MTTQKNNAGFTLLEVLISTSIFAIIALACLAIYSAVLNTSQETIALTRIQQETQMIMQVLAKKIRTSRIDYDYANYENPVRNPESELALIDLVGDEYLFALDEEEKSLTISVDGEPPQMIPATYVKIESLDFYINPTTNPFVSLEIPPSSQPYVTIVMTVSSAKGHANENLTVQQTVPQRSGGVID